MKSLRILCITLLFAVLGASQAAAVLSFGNATIFKSENDLDPGSLLGVTPANDHLFIQGDGIDNGGFALFTDEARGFQLGLRACTRFVDNALPNDGVNRYFGVSGLSGPPGANPATWNFYFHADLGANLAALVHTGDVNPPAPLAPSGMVAAVILEVDFDPGFGTTNFVALDLIQQAVLLGGATNPLLIQDSQNLGFGFWQNPPFNAPPFDPNAMGEYTFRLTALGTGNAFLGSVEIDVEVRGPVNTENASWSKLKSLYE